ncbi:enolase C-terminal domain-like protein [Streptomyces sp. PSAA01]|uniref:enolase C-terminal domain-like protein n=1 Tax=Streptomyces sp. PSAA01 TaxID=2912762 RepID=UPI0035ABD27F
MDRGKPVRSVTRFTANGGWAREAALRELGYYAEVGAEAVEQPTPPGSGNDLCWLAERSPLPVIADEDVLGYDDALQLAGKVQGVNVKLAKCGGVRRPGRHEDRPRAVPHRQHRCARLGSFVWISGSLVRVCR